MMKYKSLLLASLFSVICFLPGCAAAEESPQASHKSFFALDTAITLTCFGQYSDNAVDLITQETKALEAELSRTIPSSSVFRLNQADGAAVSASPELIELLDDAVRCSALTNGYFDATIAPIADLWGFTKNAYAVPQEKDIAALLPYVDAGAIHLEQNSARLDRNTQIDLGGIAKGYALEKTLNICREQKLDSALIDLGGDLLVYGQHPGDRPWRIGIRDPHPLADEPMSLATLDIGDAYLLTSGDYERFFTSNGKRYAHIIDPFTGYPAESDLHSVSVMMPLEKGGGTLSDALATALFVMGKDKAIDYRAHSEIPFEMILVDDSDTVLVTAGLKPYFTPLKPSRYHYSFIP